MSVNSNIAGPGRARSAKDVRAPWPELAVGVFFLVAGGGALALALLSRKLSPVLVHLLFYVGGFCLVTAAGFLPAYLTARARNRGKPGRVLPPARSGKPLHPALEKLRSLRDSAWAFLRNIDWIGDWLPLMGGALLAAASLYAFSRGWRGPAPGGSTVFNQLAGGILLGTAFPLLVLERRYAALTDALLLEARPLAALCRVPLMGVLVLALAAALRWLELPFAVTAEKIAAAVAMLVAMEILLRVAAHIFMPLPPLATRRSVAVSTIAGLIQARIPDFRSFNASVRSQFGIDLARSWALGFIRRAMPVVLLGMALFAWLLTGVTTLGYEQRAVYELMGRPVAVMQPGIHLHLPWPFGVLRPVEYGQVRQVTVEVAGSEAQPENLVAQDVPAPAPNTIEGEAPASADRLWDSTRQEVGYLVASQNGFEAINIDMTIVWRIGLSDSAAIAAAYKVGEPGAVVKSIAQQILAHYFARNTLREVLGQNREAYVRGFEHELQARLAALDSGIEVMAVVVEGIHPPAKAAASYQSVQASVIDSRIKVNTATAEAAREMKMAALVANSTLNDSRSGAAERLSQARVDSIQFEGERQAHAVGGPSFVLERRLDRIARGLADKPIIIVDHRIPAADVPGFDMRNARPPRSGFGDAAAD